MAMTATGLKQPQVAAIGNLVQFRASDPYAFEVMWLPLDRINVLEQMRKTYEKIAALADDIADKGMRNEVEVGYFTRARAAAHLKVVNEVWHADYKLTDLIRMSGKRERYVILISGHRRILAQLHLWHHGCSGCVERYGAEEPGACYGRHPKLRCGAVQCKAYDRVPPYEAMLLQSTENMHNYVPAHEQAEFYDRLFAVKRMMDSEFAVARFAREVGCGTDAMRRALRYCRLPTYFRQDVECRRYSYGVALELGRMQERLGLDEATIAGERERVIAQRLTVKQVRKTTDSLLAKAAVGEVGLFGISALTEAERVHRRSVFERKTVTALHGYAAYLRRCQPLLADGTMGARGEYLDTSTRRVVMTTVAALEAILPDLRLRLQDALEAGAVIGEVRELIEQIDRLEEQPALLS